MEARNRSQKRHSRERNPAQRGLSDSSALYASQDAEKQATTGEGRKRRRPMPRPASNKPEGYSQLYQMPPERESQEMQGRVKFTPRMKQIRHDEPPLKTHHDKKQHAEKMKYGGGKMPRYGEDPMRGRITRRDGSSR